MHIRATLIYPISWKVQSHGQTLVMIPNTDTKRARAFCLIKKVQPNLTRAGLNFGEPIGVEPGLGTREHFIRVHQKLASRVRVQ